MPTLLADEERRIKEGSVQQAQSAPKSDPDKKQQIAASIRDLEFVSARQDGQPGGVDLESDPVVKGLEKEGRDAIEPLLDCLEKDDRLARSVRFSRDFSEDRKLITVSEVAYVILMRIMQVEHFGPATEYSYEAEDSDRAAVVAEVRNFYQKHGGQTPEERWYETLRDDHATPSQWLDAANHIVQPVDFQRRSAPMSGESLRKQRTDPPVSTLMAKRVPTVAAENDGWLFAQSNAAHLALCLYRWDSTAAIPSIREQIDRCINAANADAKFIDPDPNSSQSTQTTEQMAGDVGRLATALTESHDTAGILVYCRWLVTQNPALAGDNVGQLLRPIWRFPGDKDLAAAAETIFNGNKSAWRCFPTVVQLRDWGEPSLMQSPIYGVQAFRKHVIRNLDDVTEIGVAYVQDHDLHFDTKESNEGSGPINAKDPLMPKPPETKVSVRVCDWYAWKVSQLDGAPPFELYWPLDNRNQQLPKIVDFLNRWGDHFRYTPKPQTPRGSFDDDNARLTFSPLDHPATDADVAAGKAIFSLHGGPVRTVSFAAWPVRAKWITLKDYPIQYDGKTDDFLNQGFLWQAEEVQINGEWKRYYGFVGPHVIAKVPAEQIEILSNQ